MEYFIGYLGEGHISKYYESVTTDLHSRFGIKNLSLRVPAHLTVKYPFRADDTTVIEKCIEDFLIHKPPIEFVIEGFGRFDDGIETIFLSVQPNEELATFTESCIITLGDLNENKKFDSKRFRLHMSVARHLDASTFNSVLSYVKALSNPRFELLFDNLTLFVREDGIWRAKRTFKFN